MKSMIDSVWTPPVNTVRHTGSPIPPATLSFFVAPPSEIGELYSADSNLTTSSKDSSMLKAVIWTVVICGAIAAFLYFVFESLWPVFLMAVLAVIVIFAIAVADKYTCSFVGSLGVTKATVKKNNPGMPEVSTLLFKDAIALHTSQTRHYVNGAYTGTNYQYTWKMPSGKNYLLSGSYRSQEGRPPEGDPYYMAVAAENAWTRHLLPIAIEDFKTIGHVSFPMSGKLQIIRIAEGLLEFVLKNGETQVTKVGDMKDIKLSQGRFYFKHKESTWWSGKGKYDFAYQNIPNAKLFLICLDRIAGLSFGLRS